MRKFSDDELDILDYVFYTEVAKKYLSSKNEECIFKQLQIIYKTIREDEYSALPIIPDGTVIKNISVDTKYYDVCIETRYDEINFSPILIRDYYHNVKSKLTDNVRYSFDLLLSNILCMRELNKHTEEFYNELDLKSYNLNYKKFLSLFGSMTKLKSSEESNNIILGTDDLRLIYIKSSDSLCYKLELQGVNLRVVQYTSEDESMILLRVVSGEYENNVILLYDGNILLCPDIFTVRVAKSFNREMILTDSIRRIKTYGGYYGQGGSFISTKQNQ